VGKSGGISQETQNAEVNIAQQQTDIAKQANTRANQLFGASFPGFQEAESYYQQLATGDPSAIARAIAPAAQQIDAQAEGAKQRIEQDSPRGGVKNLALAENEINKGAQIGNLATQSYLSSFQNLAGLAGQGVGQSQGFTGSAISGLSAAGNQYSNIANQQAEAKASQLGFISSLAGSGAGLAAMCWIAEEIWGISALETHIVRGYFQNHLQYGRWGRYGFRLYAKYGRQVAAKMRVSKVIRWIFQTMFSRILLHAERAALMAWEGSIYGG
jgi:hypothetical protein